MKTQKIQLKDLKDTERLGGIIGENARSGDIICLDGDLGAGKTTLVQAIARGMNVENNCYVSSPSFSLLHEYDGRLPLYHMDFYRLSNAQEVEDLGFEEYFHGSGVCVIEWSVRAIELIPEERLSLTLLINNDLTRMVTLAFHDCHIHFATALAVFCK